DGLLVVLTPQAMTDPTATARELQAYANVPRKPVLASWMGGASVEPGEQILNRAGIPTFAFPDSAAHAFTFMWRSHYNLHALYEPPSLASAAAHASGACAAAQAIIDAAREQRRSVLTEVESKQLLAAYGVPTVNTKVALSAEDAVAAACAIGFPVVLKVFSK